MNQGNAVFPCWLFPLHISGIYMRPLSFEIWSLNTAVSPILMNTNDHSWAFRLAYIPMSVTLVVLFRRCWWSITGLIYICLVFGVYDSSFTHITITRIYSNSVSGIYRYFKGRALSINSIISFISNLCQMPNYVGFWSLLNINHRWHLPAV